MKIGVVTFWQSKDNFGQLLQLYALQTFLKKLDHTPTLIRTSAVNRNCLKLKIKFFLYKLLGVKLLRCGGKNFLGFIKKNIKYTKKIFKSPKDFAETDLQYDAVITGSDVVWSEGVGADDYGELCFLGFVNAPIKKISYAASFGATSLSEDFSFFVQKKISDFDAISVREESGVDICSQFGREDAVSVCDPTMLLKKEDYEDILKENGNDGFSFGYFIGWKTNVPEDEINNFAAKNKMRCFNLNCQSGKSRLTQFFKRKSIPEWLGTYSKASCIFTNSFHGTIFALIFNKPFIYFPLGGSAQKLNDRVINLLCKMDLVSRIWNPDKSIEEQVYEKIEWTRVNSKIIKWREFSTNWLKNALES